jgi:uncharacterized protein
MSDAERKPPTCTLCDKPMDPKYRPFCSRRCADIDLHRWLSGTYAIPGDVLEDEGSSPDDEERQP